MQLFQSTQDSYRSRNLMGLGAEDPCIIGMGRFGGGVM